MKRSVLILLALVLAVVALHAQTPSHRRGLWFAAGFGMGNLRTSCDSCGRAGSGAASHFALRAGVSLFPSFLLGVEFDKLTSQRNTDAVSAIHLTSYFYPVREGNVFLKAGLGRSFFDSKTPHSPDAQHGGIGLMAGVGFDLRATTKISLTPMFTVLHARQTTGGPGPTQETAFAVSIGVTFH